MALLEVKDINVFYGQFQALQDIELAVGKGQIVSLMGTNSAGKSTLLKAITGLLKPASGTILYDGQRIDGLAPDKIVSRGIALVPQGRKIFASLSVGENLLVGSYVSQARRKRRDSLDYVLTLFPSLKARFKQPGHNLSGGEQQMLAIGRALMAQPRFIIFDEISLGLSPLLVTEIYSSVKKLIQGGLTVVLVEQDVKRSLKACDYAYIMQEGKITLKGDPRHFTEEVVKKAYFGL